MPKVNPTVYANQKSTGERVGDAFSGLGNMMGGLAQIQQAKIDREKEAQQKRFDDQYQAASSENANRYLKKYEPQPTSTESMERTGVSLPAPIANPLSIQKPNLGNGGNLMVPPPDAGLGRGVNLVSPQAQTMTQQQFSNPLSGPVAPEASPAAAMTQQPQDNAVASSPQIPSNQPNLLGKFASLGEHAKILEDISGAFNEINRADDEQMNDLMDWWKNELTISNATHHQKEFEKRVEMFFKPRMEMLSKRHDLNMSKISSGINAVLDLMGVKIYAGAGIKKAKIGGETKRDPNMLTDSAALDDARNQSSQYYNRYNNGDGEESDKRLAEAQDYRSKLIQTVDRDAFARLRSDADTKEKREQFDLELQRRKAQGR